MRTLIPILFVLLLSASPVVVSAQAGGAVAICRPCDNVKVICPPCKALTGFGICMPPGGPTKCLSKGVTQGDGSMDGASAQGAQQMMQMAQGLIEKLMQKKGGGGGGGEGGAQVADPFQNAQTAPTTANDVLGDILNTALSGESTNDTVNDILGSLSSEFGDDVVDDAEVKTVIEQLVGLAQGTTTTEVATDAAAENVAYESALSLPDITVLGNSIVTSVVRGLTGIGTFFAGGSSSTGSSPSFFASICTSRPWTSGIFSTLFSPSFFDNLCTSRGYSTAPPQLPVSIPANNAREAELVCPGVVDQGDEVKITWSCGMGVRSAGVGFDTDGTPAGFTMVSPEETAQYELQCANGGRAQCTVQVVSPEVTLEVSPKNVILGGRARVFWSSEGTSECVVEGLGMRQEGTSGAAATPAIYDLSTFTVTCSTMSGGTIEDSVTVDIGA